jgi:hypothetical protein
MPKREAIYKKFKCGTCAKKDKLKIIPEYITQNRSVDVEGKANYAVKSTMEGNATYAVTSTMEGNATYAVTSTLEGNITYTLTSTQEGNATYEVTSTLSVSCHR